MATQLVTQLVTIREKIKDLDIDEVKAKEFEDLISKSIEIIQSMQNPSDDFFENKRKTALYNLEYDLGRNMKGYWQSPGKIEKISQFSSARNHANIALSSVIASFRR